MSRLGSIYIAAELVEQKQDKLWMARLKNGHEVYAFLCSELKNDPLEFREGEWVLLEISPFELSEGCILKKLKAITNES